MQFEDNLQGLTLEWYQNFNMREFFTALDALRKSVEEDVEVFTANTRESGRALPMTRRESTGTVPTQSDTPLPAAAEAEISPTVSSSESPLRVGGESPARRLSEHSLPSLHLEGDKETDEPLRPGTGAVTTQSAASLPSPPIADVSRLQQEDAESSDRPALFKHPEQRESAELLFQDIVAWTEKREVHWTKEEGEVVSDWSSCTPEEGGWVNNSDDPWEPEKEESETADVQCPRPATLAAPSPVSAPLSCPPMIADVSCLREQESVTVSSNRLDLEDKMQQLEEQLELERERAEVLCEDRERWKKEYEVLYAERELLRAERHCQHLWRRGRGTPSVSHPLFPIAEVGTFQQNESKSAYAVAAINRDFLNEITGRETAEHDNKAGGGPQPLSCLSFSSERERASSCSQGTHTEGSREEAQSSSEESQKNAEVIGACRQVHPDSPGTPPRFDGNLKEPAAQSEPQVIQTAALSLNGALQPPGDEGGSSTHGGFKETKVSECKQDLEEKMRQLEEQLELERERVDVLHEHRERWKKEKEGAGYLCESLYAKQQLLKAEKQQALATLQKEKEEPMTAVEKERQKKEDLQICLSAAEHKNAQYQTAEHRLLQNRECLENKIAEMQQAALSTAKEKEAEISRLQQQESKSSRSFAVMKRDLEEQLECERETVETLRQEWERFKAQREETEGTLRAAKPEVENEVQEREVQILQAFADNRGLHRQVQTYSQQALQRDAHVALLKKRLSERDRHFEEKVGLVSALRGLLEDQAQLLEDQTAELNMYRQRFEELGSNGEISGRIIM
uniref:Uncharacterized protein n=1 Tax=Chromera velia CCMP2878 TaxID=1169474 RepID=A0A0G4FJA0_9ALVE|eukprot:Cvel_3389.t1-p1 / transcript=Cvel_3389.t1 / gene=Cvel_3389 / organism=Chromera_velia_CCMP2878 / gene_product=hypothetical protein / transcript_product=hypothetical protein / location=Cvel_scaffold136:90811-94351(-) / protein_length=796 / sequence_SO=supercontig / SO=protein_coding / is_pseudo=false